MTTLLRLATAGSVDDGKSTLIGRLLYDSKAVMEDQLASVERTSKERGHDYTDLALVTDGLRAEREQGITIDVAYRYFATPRDTFSTPATWLPGRRPRSWRSSWSMPGMGCSNSPAATRFWRRFLASSTSC
jgi:sulfate adenylyltransferase subunit 1 (EFTu-like GTPase family)